MFAVAASNVNGGLVDFFHGVQVAIMLMLMTNILQFAWWTCKKMRRGHGHWYMFRPVYIILVSTPMVLLQPVCMLVIGSWICKGHFSADQLGDGITPCDSPTSSTPEGCQGHFLSDGHYSDRSASYVQAYAGSNFVDGCSDTMKNFFFDGGGDSNALTPNTTVGWCIQIFGTYGGFILMFIGVAQATQIHRKLINRWRSIRSS